MTELISARQISEQYGDPPAGELARLPILIPVPRAAKLLGRVHVITARQRDLLSA